MNIRQEKLLFQLIESYVSCAEPISSALLSKRANVHVSSATIRNELAALEEAGFLQQPHTSAGRIPTIQGIEHYLSHIQQLQELSDAEQRRFNQLFSRFGIRGLAREAAHYCKAATVMAFNKNDFYFTGFSNLLAAPECADADLVRAIGKSIDEIEYALPHIVDEGLSKKPRVYIGKKNPLGPDCAAFFVSDESGERTVVGLISTIRTNYRKNLAVMNTISAYL